MKLFRKALAFSLGCGILLTTAACSGDTEPSLTSGMPDTDPVTDPITDSKPLDPPPPTPWESDGEAVKIDSPANYTVVIPEAHSEMISFALTELVIALSPFEAKGNEPPATPLSLIHLGDDGSDAVKAAKEEIKNELPKGDWYYIGMQGKDVVLLGSCDTALMGAARHLIRGYLAQGQPSYAFPKKVLCPCPLDALPVSIREKGQPVTFAAKSNLSHAPWYLDMSGEQDGTNLLQAALYDADAVGGGTVFLPKGRVLLSDALRIPSGVTLRGHYADPDTQSLSDGTLLLLASEEFKRVSPIALSSSSAVQGITFFYPEQNIASPIEYAVTVLAEKAKVYTVRDCTFLNSYRAISSGGSAIGIVTIDGVKGTALRVGIETGQHADVSCLTDITFSPIYWASADASFSPPSEKKIRDVMGRINSVGLLLGDCDRDTYMNLTLDGFRTGIRAEKPSRVGSSGSFYRLKIKNAVTGIHALGVDTRYGWQLIDCEIEGKKAIVNETDGVGGLCQIHLLGSTVKGTTTSGVIVHKDALVSPEIRSEVPVSAPPRVFSIADYGADPTGKADSAPALQAALDQAKMAGGGIVYLPAGKYRIEQSVKGGANTVIQGAYVNALGGTADFSGTTLLVTYGRGQGATDTAAITMEGDHCGITGLTVYYPENGVRTDAKEQKILSYAPFARMSGKGCYLTYSCFIAASRVVHFDQADGFIADRITGTVYDNTVYATACAGGSVSRIHVNGTYHTGARTDQTVLGSDWLSDGGKVVAQIIDPYLSKRLTHVILKDCQKVQLVCVFYYGGVHILHAEGSDIITLNCEGARTGSESFRLDGDCTLLAYNTNRPNGDAYLKAQGQNTAEFFFMNLAAVKMIVTT